jgi:SAM-dependent methyltransferase
MTDRALREAMITLFAGRGWSSEAQALIDASLAPRSPDLLVDVAGALGLRAGQLALDLGCRDGHYAIELARRFRCRVIGVDLVAAWLAQGLVSAAEAGLGGMIAMVQGDAEALPVADASCDLVWCRDVLSCVGDCGRALAECARVLRPGGGMMLYAAFTTSRLEPREHAHLVTSLEQSAASMDQPTVEAAIAAAGLQVLRRDQIGSEFFEWRLEHDSAHLTADLLRIARMTRMRDRFEANLGPPWYERTLAFAQWGLYIVLGKLKPVVYALVKPA